jgi:hypothetical protein
VEQLPRQQPLQRRDDALPEQAYGLARLGRAQGQHLRHQIMGGLSQGRHRARHARQAYEHGQGIGDDYCLVCQRLFDVLLAALIKERGGDARVVGMKR